MEMKINVEVQQVVCVFVVCVFVCLLFVVCVFVVCCLLFVVYL